MNLDGFVFGPEDRRMLASLTHSEGVPADVWVPLDVHHASGRSGWHVVPRHPSPFAAFEDKSDVHCVWPTPFLRWYLGRHALLPDAALCGRDVTRRYVKKREGIWQAKIPRFFTTVAEVWWSDFGFHSSLSTDVAERTQVGRIDLVANLAKYNPLLIVGPNGPVFYEPGAEEDFTSRRRAAIEPLMRLPPRTPVRLIHFGERDNDYSALDEWYADPYRRHDDSVWPPASEPMARAWNPGG